MVRVHIVDLIVNIWLIRATCGSHLVASYLVSYKLVLVKSWWDTHILSLVIRISWYGNRLLASEISIPILSIPLTNIAFKPHCVNEQFAPLIHKSRAYDLQLQPGNLPSHLHELLSALLAQQVLHAVGGVLLHWLRQLLLNAKSVASFLTLLVQVLVVLRTFIVLHLVHLVLACVVSVNIRRKQGVVLLLLV